MAISKQGHILSEDFNMWVLAAHTSTHNNW